MGGDITVTYGRHRGGSNLAISGGTCEVTERLYAPSIAELALGHLRAPPGHDLDGPAGAPAAKPLAERPLRATSPAIAGPDGTLS